MMLPLAFIPEKQWMLRALELAHEAARAGEVPVGAVVVKDGRILGEGRNRREAAHTALGHAELEAIHNACQTLGTWRLTGCTLYVTLEPCPMCTGAIINAHVDRVVYGADDDRAGCCGTAMDLFALPYSHRPEIYRGFYEAEAKALLREFFQKLRKETGERA
jgi:tRNA(adenine34) deaminase